MNKKAKELNLNNTHFVTPHGLDDEKHYTTAYELALLTDYAMQNKKFTQIVNTKFKTILINGEQRQIHNTNELLGVLNGVNGVKTGFTNNAGRCLVCSCLRDGMDIISVVLGADTKKFRTQDSIKIIEYAYQNYEYINLKEIVEKKFNDWKNTYHSNIIKGETQNFNFDLESLPNEMYSIKRNTKNLVNVKIISSQNEFYAPVKEKTNIGSVNVYYDNELIYKLAINTAKNVEKKDLLRYIYEIIFNIKNIIVNDFKLREI